MQHLIYRFPADAPDTRIQVDRLLSGAGTHDSHPDGASNWCVKWHGEPRATLERRRSWIGFCVGGYIEGWARFCHDEYDAVSHFGDPAVRREGPVLFVDRYQRLATPTWYGNDPTRHHYIDAATVGRFGVPGQQGGRAISWVDAGQTRVGCLVCGP